MASTIRIKRSTGTAAPGSLAFGELGATLDGGGTQANKGDRVFIGDNGGNVQVIGGRYYTDLLSIAPGLVAGQAHPTAAARGFVAVLDQNRKVDEWNVDNITLNANTVSTTNTDGIVKTNQTENWNVNHTQAPQAAPRPQPDETMQIEGFYQIFQH